MHYSSVCPLTVNCQNNAPFLSIAGCLPELENHAWSREVVSKSSVFSKKSGLFI
jgi:hypothetical protein